MGPLLQRAEGTSVLHKATTTRFIIQWHTHTSVLSQESNSDSPNQVVSDGLPLRHSAFCMSLRFATNLKQCNES